MKKRTVIFVCCLILSCLSVSISEADYNYYREWQSPQGAVYFPNISDVQGPAPFDGYDVNGNGRAEIVWYEYEGVWGGPQNLVFHAIDSQDYSVVWLWSCPINESEGIFCQLLGFFDLDADGQNEGLFKIQNTNGNDRIVAVDVASGGYEWQMEDYSIWVNAIFDIDGDGFDELILNVTEDASGDHHYIEIWGADAPVGAPAPEPPLRLGRNHPNPFNPATRIDYSLESPGQVSIRILSPSGRKLRTLLCERQDAGSYSIDWDGRDERGIRLSSGMYFYELRSNGQRASRKMIMLK